MFDTLWHNSHQSTSWHPIAFISQRFTLAAAYIYRKDKRAHLGLPERLIFSTKTVAPVTLNVCLILNLNTLPVYLWFVEDKVVLRWAFLRIISFSLISNFPPLLYIHYSSSTVPLIRRTSEWILEMCKYKNAALAVGNIRKKILLWIFHISDFKVIVVRSLTIETLGK